jgi:two-component system response regulator EvgA
VLTSKEAKFYAARCLRKGAMGFISKTDHLDELTKAIRAVMSGHTFFPNLATHSVCDTDNHVTDLELIQSLTDRELAILQQLSFGLTNKEIGDAMLLSNKTISTYKTRIIEKLKVKSVVYLADFAKRNNLV